ncbi:MAG: META domain-containing protein [Caldilinea sp.]|nr:META domain-containing protein [Caldilinea sp.]MDW8439938.1 META domain-containing protein [Caldilineaceae bacterium]
MKNTLRIILTPILVVVLAFSTLPASSMAAPLAASLQQEEPASSVLTLEALANLTYRSQLTPSGEITLVDGRYEDPANGVFAVLAAAPMAFGTLNGEDAAAVLLAESSGASSVFVTLAVVVDQDGQPVNVASALLGDRVDVQALTIDGSRILVDMVRHGPNDPMCCPTEVVRLIYGLGDEGLVLAGVNLVGSSVSAALEVAPEGGYQMKVMPATPYDVSTLIPTGAPIHTLLTFGDDDPATVFADGGPYIAIYPVQEYIRLWEEAGDLTIANLVEELERILSEQPASLRAPLPIVPPADVDDLVAQVGYLEGKDFSGVRFVARSVRNGVVSAEDQLAYHFTGLTDDGRYLISVQWPVETTATLTALDAAPDAAWTPTLSSLDAIIASLTIQRPEWVTAEELGNLTYYSVMLEKPVTLSSGVYTETVSPDVPAGVVTVQLLGEPIAYGKIDGVDSAAALIVEYSGGTGQYYSLELVQRIDGETVNTASAFLGDRSRIQNIVINEDGSITVDMVAVGPNDAFCCANMPTTVNFVKVGDRLVVQEETSATIDLSGLDLPFTATVKQATAYDASVPPGDQGQPKHFSWVLTDDETVQGYISVYPVEAYLAIWEEADEPFVADTLAQLQTLLEEQPANPTPPLPFLPPLPASNDFAAQVRYLDLADGGVGVRFVGRFVQDMAPIENPQLRYLFQGLSADGEFLIVANLPVTTSALPAEPQPLSGEEYDQFVAVYTTYLAEMTTLFNGLTGADFTPDLEALDAALQSVTPERTVNPLAPISLANMTINSELASDGVAPLTNGVYTETVAPGSPGLIEVRLLPEPMAYGVINEQEAVAAIVAESDGGSGLFVNLALIVEQEGAPVHVASAPLGDRVEVQQLSIVDDQITLTMLTLGPDDPICCPSQRVSQTYAWENEALVLVEESVETVSEATSPLSDVSWLWVETVFNDGTRITPETEGAFTLTFTPEGRVSATTDCNTFTGSYRAEEGQLSIEFLISTAMDCPEGAQEQEFIADVAAANGYFITEDGRLALSLPFDSGSVIFAPSTGEETGEVAPAEDEATTETVAGEAVAEAPTALPGTSWNWVRTQYSNGAIVAPADPTLYVLTFGEDGTVNVRDDCNVLNGVFTTDEEQRLTIDLQTSTMAACAPDSLHYQFILDLSATAFYSFQEGRLLIELKFDTGVMEFAPAN